MSASLRRGGNAVAPADVSTGMATWTPRFLALAVVVLATACMPAGPTVSSSSAPSALSADPVVPWADLPYADLPAPTLSPRPSAAACGPAALKSDGVTHDGAGGTTFHHLAVHNKGTSVCTLAGHPALTGRRKGRTVPIPAHTNTMAPPPVAGATPATIGPGDEADLIIETYGGCLDGRPAIVYADVRVLVAGGSIALGEDLDATCGVSVGQWARSGPEPEPVPLGLTAEIAAPASVQPGTDLTFTVTLVNPQDHPVRLEPCPNFIMGLSDIKAGGVHQLNCQGRTISAGGRLAFAMVLAIPSSAPAGTVMISWTLDDVAATPVPVTIS
jgi:hypothetical protein